MDENRIKEIKGRVLGILKERGDMAISEIHQRLGISFYDLKDIVPIMVQENSVELLGKKVHLKEEKHEISQQ